MKIFFKRDRVSVNSEEMELEQTSTN